MGSPSAAERGLNELEAVARQLEEELAGWRRRCLKAETELEEIRSRVPPITAGDVALMRQRTVDLEAENQLLRDRIDNAREQLEQLRTRLRFVGEQAGGER